MEVVVKVLIDGASVLVVDGGISYISTGYLYMENGLIKSLGAGQAPDELLYPELLLGGAGRLVAKGFASGFTVLSLYPLRYGLDDVDWFLMKELAKTIKRTDMYFISVLSLAELVSKGVTEVLVVDTYLDEVARASRDVGVNVTLAPPLNCGLDDQQQLNELKLLLGRWHGRVEGVKVGFAVCREIKEDHIALAKEANIPIYALELEKEPPKNTENAKIIAVNPVLDTSFPVIYYGRMLRNWKRDSGIGIGVRPSYSVREVVKEILWSHSADPVDALLSGTKTTSELIDQRESSTLREGSRGSIVVYNLSEPPGWPLPRSLHSAIRAVLEGDAPIETVVVGDDIVLDREGILTVGHELFKKAIRRFEEIYPTLPPLISRQQL
ncbi:MAG: hypothetical protein QXZ37_01545 [Sulfolobales archaeon]